MNAKSKAAAQIRALARRHTRAAIKVLAAIIGPGWSLKGLPGPFIFPAGDLP